MPIEPLLNHSDSYILSHKFVNTGYDSGLSVPLGSSRKGAAFLTPPNGKPLHQATISLEHQYAQDLNFRRSLIKGLNQTRGIPAEI